jgi:hypothetical protein
LQVINSSSQTFARLFFSRNFLDAGQSAPLSPAQSLLSKILSKTTDAAAQRDKELNHGSLNSPASLVHFDSVASFIVNANPGIM